MLGIEVHLPVFSDTKKQMALGNDAKLAPRHVPSARVSAVLLVVTLMSTSGWVRAQDGYYIDLSLGGGTLGDLVDSDGFTTAFWPGPTFSAGIGYKWRRLRLEGGLFHGYFLVDEQSGPGGDERPRPVPPSLCFLCGTTGVNGELRTWAFMANAYLDLDLSDNTRVYIGGGIGAARVSAEYEFDETLLGFSTGESIEFVDDRDSVLAYQARVGFVFAVGTKSDAYLGYRFLATEDMGFDTVSGGRLDQEGLDIHVGELGFRYHF